MPIATNDNSGISPQLAALLKAQVAMEAYKRRFTPDMLPPEPTDPFADQNPLQRQQAGLGNTDIEKRQFGKRQAMQGDVMSEINSLVAGAANKQRLDPAAVGATPPSDAAVGGAGMRVPTSLIAGNYTQGEMSPLRLANAMERGALRKNRQYGGGDMQMMDAQLQMAKQADQMFPEQQQPQEAAPAMGQMAGGADQQQDPLFLLANRLANVNPGIGQQMKASIMGQADPTQLALAKLHALGPALAASGDKYKAEMPMNLLTAQLKQKQELDAKDARIADATQIVGKVPGWTRTAFDTFVANAKKEIKGITDDELKSAWRAKGGRPFEISGQPSQPMATLPDEEGWWRWLWNIKKRML